MMKWFIFDQFDCMGEYEFIADAAPAAASLVADGFEGVHIVYFTPDQLDEYCTNNNLVAAFNVK